MALSGDTSGSAMAQRAKLEEELAKAKQEREDLYYDRSIENQQSALDQSLESFQEEKDKEIEGWEKYLENIEVVVADSLDAVRENTSAVLTTLQEMQTHYGLMVTDALMSPWQAGESAIQIYGERLNMSLTALAGLFGMTVDQFAAKLGITTEQLVAGLNITVGQVAETLGLTNEQMAAKLGLTMAEYSTMADGTIQQLAANMGITLPELAEKLGTTTAGLAGNLDMTMAQFANAMGLSVDELANKFGLSARDLADKLGTTYQDLTNPFGLAMSATVDELERLVLEYSNILASIEGDSKIAVDSVNKAMDEYQKAQDNKNKPQDPKKEEPKKQENKPKAIGIGSRVNAGNATIYADSYGGGAGKQYFSNDPNYIVLDENNGYVLVRHHKLSSGYTGWFKKSDLKAYATGSKGVGQDQWAILDELGEELQLIPGKNGRLEYIKKGTGIIPADATSNLMSWSELNPQDMLDRNRPAISAPHVVNNEINIDCSVGTMVHIEHCDQNTLPDVEKLVNKAFDKHMQTLNNSIRSKVR